MSDAPQPTVNPTESQLEAAIEIVEAVYGAGSVDHANTVAAVLADPGKLRRHDQVWPSVSRASAMLAMQR